MLEFKETSVADGETEGGRQTEMEAELSKGEQETLRRKERGVDGCTADSPKSQHASVPAPVC